MASLGMGFGAAAAAAAAAGSGRAIATRASKSSGGGSTEEKGLLDFILGSLQKEDQLLETDPVLNKTDANKTRGNGRPGAGKSTTSISVPDSKKSGGGVGGVFGGLFAKK